MPPFHCSAGTPAHCDEKNLQFPLDPTSTPKNTESLKKPQLCPTEENEFILYATRYSIHRYDLASGLSQELPLAGLRGAVALDFDYEHNCLYWADVTLDIIQVSRDSPGQKRQPESQHLVLGVSHLSAVVESIVERLGLEGNLMISVLV